MAGEKLGALAASLALHGGVCVALLHVWSSLAQVRPPHSVAESGPLLLEFTEPGPPSNPEPGLELPTDLPPAEVAVEPSTPELPAAEKEVEPIASLAPSAPTAASFTISEPAARSSSKQQAAKASRSSSSGSRGGGGANGGGRSMTYTPPRYLNCPAPAYPAEADRQRISGLVLLTVRVDENGHVRGSQVHRSSGYANLDHAAQQAVSRWTFHPARQGDRAIAAIVEVPVRFRVR